MWDIVALILVASAAIKIAHWLHRWQNPKCNGKLPPGDMGYPVFGKVFELFTPHGLYDVLPFVQKHVQRYGPLSRTNLIGFNTIISTDPETNYEILKEEDKSFVIGYSQKAIEIFGKSNLFTGQGNIHKYVKNVTFRLMGPESLKTRLIHQMDAATLEGMETAATKGVVDFKRMITKIIHDIVKKNIMHDMPPEVEKEIKEFYTTFTGDFYKMAFKIAWSSMRSCTARHKRATELIKELIQNRRASGIKKDDFLGIVIDEMEKDGTVMNEESAVQLIFMLPVLSSDAIANSMSIGLKLLTENPTVVAELKKEHETIIQKRKDKEGRLTWEEYKSMTFTPMVLNEILRLASIAPFMIRKAIRDVDVKGYTIPAGWYVLVVPSVVHFDSKIYEDPFSFNPWRWEKPELMLWMGRHHMVFGGGARLCVGAQFSKLQMAIVLHNLVTKFKWSIKAEGKIIREPTPKFHNGLHVQLTKI